MKEANWTKEPVKAPEVEEVIEVEECTDPEVIEVFESGLMTDDELTIDELEQKIFKLQREAYSFKNVIKSLIHNPDYAHGFKDAVSFMDEVGL